MKKKIYCKKCKWTYATYSCNNLTRVRPASTHPFTGVKGDGFVTNRDANDKGDCPYYVSKWKFWK